METRFSLTLKQLALIVILVFVLAAGFSLVVFYLGQRSVVGTAARDSATPSMPPLPKAMTATPAALAAQNLTFTEGDILLLLEDQAGSSAPLALGEVEISSEAVTLDGAVDYADYQGHLHVSGQPYPEGGKLQFRIASMVLDGQTVPQVLYPTIEAQINTLFEQLLDGYDVTAVSLEAGQITLTVVPW